MKMKLSRAEGHEFKAWWGALIGSAGMFGDSVYLSWIGDKGPYFHGAGTCGAPEGIEFEDTF